MTATTQKYLSLEEYFELEYRSEIRHEYLNGKVHTMGYTSINHNRIVRNLNRIFDLLFLEEKSEIFTENRMLFVPDCNKVYYPDALIIKDEHKLYNYKGKMDATLNPTVLIEIGSDSTENQDKTNKWHCYQSIESLRQYIMISQKFMFVEIFERQEHDIAKWIYTSADSYNDVVNISGYDIILKDIYHKVEFPPEEVKDEEVG